MTMFDFSGIGAAFAPPRPTQEPAFTGLAHLTPDWRRWGWPDEQSYLSAGSPKTQYAQWQKQQQAAPPPPAFPSTAERMGLTHPLPMYTPPPNAGQATASQELAEYGAPPAPKPDLSALYNPVAAAQGTSAVVSPPQQFAGTFMQPGVTAPAGSLRAQAQATGAQDYMGIATGLQRINEATAIPGVTPFLRNTVAPAVGDIAAASGAALGIQPLEDVGRFLGESVVPTTGLELGLEAIPGVGIAPDIARGARRLGSEATEAGLRRYAMGGTPEVVRAFDEGAQLGDEFAGLSDQALLQRFTEMGWEINPRPGGVEVRDPVTRVWSMYNDLPHALQGIRSDIALQGPAGGMQSAQAAAAGYLRDLVNQGRITEEQAAQMLRRQERPPIAGGAPEPQPVPPVGPRVGVSEAQQPPLPGVGVAEGVPDPVSRLADLVKTTRRLPPITQAERSAALRQRVAIGAHALEQGGRTQEAFGRARGALAGELPRAEFEAPSISFAPEEVQQLRDVLSSKNLRFFEDINTNEALNKVLEGRLNEVRPFEIALLDKTFGPQLADAVANKQGWKFGEELISLLGLPRTIKASFDISAPGRQGLALAARHPQEWLEGWVPMIKSYVSAGAARTADEQSEAMLRGWRDEFGDDLVHLYGGEERVPGFEPQGSSKIGRWLRKFPGIANSERAFGTFLNVQKSKTFNTMATALQRAGVTDPEQYKRLGSIIDHATGFGAAPLGSSTAGRLGGQTFFSQRLMTSRFQFLTDPIVEGLMKGDLRATKAATENLVAFFGAQLGLIELGDQLGIWDAELDPRSTDFGKMRFGPVRIDPMAGFSPLLRQAARVATGERKSLTGAVFDTDRGTEALGFFRNKLAPVPSTIVSLLTGENAIGEKPTVDSVMKDLLLPLFADSFIEGWQTGGLEGALVSTLPESVGLGTLTYGAGQAAQADIARQQYHTEYDDLSAREQAEINAQANQQRGIDMEWRDRQAPWWTARENGMERWRTDLIASDPTLAEDPFVQKALEISQYADLATELSAWAQETYGVSRIQAEQAVDQFLRQTQLQDYINAFRKDVLDADPGTIAAWDKAYEEGKVDFAPPKWAREFITENAPARQQVPALAQ